MMEFEIGGIYKIVRKPLNRVKLYERKSDAGRHYYKYSMNAKILVISKAEKISRRRGQRCVAYFFKSREIEHFVECFYGVWIKKMHLIKKERDISKWPHLARKHFLMAKGASVEAAIEGTLEDAHRQIANVARKTRLDKENRERQVKQAFDFDLGLRSNSTKMMYVTVDSSTTAGEVATASPAFQTATYEMGSEDPNDYGDFTDDDVWEVEDVTEAEPVSGSTTVGLTPGYFKKAKKRGKKLAKKKKRKKRNQLPITQRMYTPEAGYKEDLAATTVQPTQPRYKSRSDDRKELEELAYGKDVDPRVRVTAIGELEEMDREDEEIRNTIKETKIKMEKKRSSFNAWYSEQTDKKEETE